MWGALCTVGAVCVLGVCRGPAAGGTIASSLSGTAANQQCQRRAIGAFASRLMSYVERGEGRCGLWLSNSQTFETNLIQRLLHTNSQIVCGFRNPATLYTQYYALYSLHPNPTVELLLNQSCQGRVLW